MVATENLINRPLQCSHCGYPCLLIDKQDCDICNSYAFLNYIE